QSKPGWLRIFSAKQAGIGFQLWTIQRGLLRKEVRQGLSLNGRGGLVINDPALLVLVDETAVHDVLATPATGVVEQRQFTGRFPVLRAEQPVGICCFHAAHELLSDCFHCSRYVSFCPAGRPQGTLPEWQRQAVTEPIC